MIPVSITPPYSCYKSFSRIYDRVMRDVNYKAWADYIELLVRKFNLRKDRVLNLACGTGSLDMELVQRGWNLKSIDRSLEMLEVAMEKSLEANLSLDLEQGEMESFEIGEKFDLILCLYDSLNYLLEEEKVKSTFQRASAHLNSGGSFIFDITTEYNIIQNFVNFTFAENFEDSAYIWENQYRFESKICESKIIIFLEKDGVFHRYEENHHQKVYSQKFLRQALSESGLEVLAAYSGFTTKSPLSTAERIHFVSRKLTERKTP